MLSKEDLVAVELKTKEIKLQSGTVLIKEFTTADREKFELLALKMTKGGTNSNMKARVIAISLVKENGGRMFGDNELDKIAGMPSTITETIFNEILSLNGMGEDALETEEGN